MCGRGADFDSVVRRAFAKLTGEDLPRAAVERGWPVRTPEEFERLLLDHLADGPAAGVLPSTFDLVLAVELGERMLAGHMCCAKMRRRQQCGDADIRRAEAWDALLGVLGQASRSRNGC